MRPASVAAFGLSLFLSFSTAYAVDLSPSTHRAVPGDFNGDGLVDELLQPLNGTLPSGIFYRDAAGELSIAGQVWQPTYLGLDWGTDSSTLYTADFQGAGRSDILLQPLKSGANGALLFPTPDGQFLNIGQTIPSPYLGFDWSAESHAIYTGHFDGGPQSEVLLQAASHGGLNGIVHPDSQGRLTQLVETWPDDFLGIPWDAATVSLYVGDFNGDGQDDLLVQVNRPDPSAQAYYLLLADTAGKFSTIKQSWGLNAFGGNWNPATHKLSVQTINGVTSVVLTATDGGSNYVYQANANGVFDKPAAQWQGTKAAPAVLAGAAANNGNPKGAAAPLSGSGVKTMSSLTGSTNMSTLAAGTAPSGNTPGTIHGKFSVDANGAANYVVPLDIPGAGMLLGGTAPFSEIAVPNKGLTGAAWTEGVLALGMVGDLSKLSAFSRIGSTGRIGEDALKLLGGESHAYFGTPIGPRYIDQLVSGVANESKVGYTSLTVNVRNQIAKDVWLMQNGRVDSVTWHFYTSPITGLGKPSLPLRNFLIENNITVEVH